MSATRRQHVRRSCLRTWLVALVGTAAVGATAGPALGITAGPALGAAPAVLPLVTGCGLLVTIPVGVQAGIAVAALPGGQSITVAFAGPLISAAGTTIALAGADVGASGVRVTLTVDGVAQQPVTLFVPGCVAATPAPATPTVGLSPPPRASLPGTPVEGPPLAPAPTPVDPAGRPVTGLADLTSRGPSDAVPSAQPPAAQPPFAEPPAAEEQSAETQSAEAPAGAAGGPAVALLEPPSAGPMAAGPGSDVLLTQLFAAGPVAADAPLTVRLLSASPSTAARFPASLSARALFPASLSPASLSAALSGGSSPVAGALPQVAPPATTPPDSGADAPTLTGSALPITAASRLLRLGGPATGADLTTTGVLLAGALAVVVGQAARRRQRPPRPASSPRVSAPGR